MTTPKPGEYDGKEGEACLVILKIVPSIFPLIFLLDIYTNSGIITIMEQCGVKPLVWIGSSRDDLKEFPDEVNDVIGYALYLAQTGGKHPAAKPLKGFTGAGVLEVVDDYDTNTYRAVYTVKLSDTVYVLHSFQKKSKSGIATPQKDINLIKARLQQAIERLMQGKRGNEYGRHNYQ